MVGMARRVLIVFVVFLVVGPLVGLLVGGPREPVTRERDDPAQAERADPPRAVVSRIARLPRDEAVRARVGDLVALTVTSKRPDSVEIPTLGLSEAVAPEAPAQLDFLADRPGRHPVVLSLSGARAGEIVVRAR